MEKILNKLLKVPYIVMALSIVISVIFLMKMMDNTRMETNLDKYMPEEHPAFIYSDQAEEWFNIKDGIIIAVENKKGIYNKETLDIVKALTKRFQKMPEIEKADVTSLYTADNIVGTEDGMDVKAFYKKTPKTAEKFEELRQKVKTNEMVYGRLVSTDESVTIIIAAINKDVFTQEFYNHILETADEFQTENVILHVAGRPIIEGTMALLGPADMKKMVPIVLLIIVFVLYFILRSIRSTILTMLVVLFSTLWAFGLMAVVNIPIYAVSTMIPVMLIAIGVADGIHLYSHLHLFMMENPAAKKKEAVMDMIKYMWSPVVMTSITTAVGFVSLLTSQVYPIKYFGLFTAFGVLTAMLFSLTIIPAGIMIFGLPKMKIKKEKENNHQFAFNFAEKVIKYRVASMIITVAIIVLSIVGISKVWINSSFLDKFEKDSDIVLTDQFINEHFGGTSTINLILDSDSNDAFKNPEVLRLVDKMQQDVVGNLAIAGNSFTLTDYVKRMNKVMNADDEAYNTIPDDSDLIAQYLLLYEMSGDPENLWKVVDYDYAKLNVNFQVKSDNSKAINSVLSEIESFEDDFAKLGVKMNYAGSGYKALIFTDLILEGQIMSLVLSLIIVIVLLGVMFKNIKLGFIGAVPIIITAIVSFGIMGWFDIALNTTTALLSSIAIGIGIDYAVHFIEQYKLNSTSGNKLLTAQKTMAHSGRAILFNAVVVIAGFLVLLFSVFPPNRELGTLVSLNMFLSFVGTVTIMLNLLYRFNIYFEKKNKGE
ncbi:MAG: efflux RND transporter permease subunit [Melioribacteraceae bacterium]|nr:efflux RND transporter permease subunit [Melioribacteraceae bacterium]